ARELGSIEPDHYLFPFRIHRAKFDPTRHQTSFKTARLKLIVGAGLPGFRQYDLRHHAITVLLENPHVSEETAEAVAGHISREMKKRYSHLRMDSRRLAVDGMILAKKKPQSERRMAPSRENSSKVARELVTLLSKLLKTG
ncbi:MAG: hypothetical protein LAO09_22580, partial [Acidobacteriia bacterium]|nr:hypothetical protein [Terriglobia bacterium]